MIRKRWIYPADGGDPFEVGHDYVPEPKSALVFGDLPDYESPIDGHIVSGRVQRREDLKRNGCRPWEGREQEQKEAQRRLQYHEHAADAKLTDTVLKNLHQMRPEVRRALLGR
jgi:hypothetical protein